MTHTGNSSPGHNELWGKLAENGDFDRIFRMQNLAKLMATFADLLFDETNDQEWHILSNNLENLHKDAELLTAEVTELILSHLQTKAA